MSFSSQSSLAIKPMTNQTSPDFEFDALQSTTVDLLETDVDWAIRVSQSATDDTAQWQDFLRALAIKGFQQWLEAGAQDIAVYAESEQAPPAGVNCRVGDFRLCLIAQGSLGDEVVSIPCSTLDDAHQFAHLYVLLEVQEEVERVTVLSSLRRDRLLAHRQASLLEAESNGTYAIPASAFDSSPEDLLLYLNCLQPAQLAATAGVASDGPVSATEAPGSPGLVPNFGEDLINVGRWLRDQIGEVADQLAWNLLPPITSLQPAIAFRSPAEEISTILTEMSPAVTVPPNARGAYTDCQPFGLPFRLYALTWTLFETETPEWSLLLCLGPSGSSQLPPGVKLRIRDRASVLVEQTLEPDSESTYLYGQVIGTWDEQFVVAIELPNGTTLNWPPFTFQPDR